MFNSNLLIIIIIYVFGFPYPIFPHKFLTCGSWFTFHRIFQDCKPWDW